MEPIDVETASDEELGCWLAENVVNDETVQETGGIFHLPHSDWIETFDPCRVLPHADMCLAKFWDRWGIIIRRWPSGMYNGTAGQEDPKCTGYPITFRTKSRTEARCRAELAALIALEEARDHNGKR